MWAIIALVLFTPGATGKGIPESLYEGPVVIAHYETAEKCSAALNWQIEQLQASETAEHQTTDLGAFGICWNMTPITRS